MDTPLTLLMLAAGMGSRYGGLKQLDAMGPHGETLMDYSLFDARRAGFQRLVFVIRREMEAEFEANISSRLRNYFDVVHAYQELDRLPGDFTVPEGRSKPWGTGHAVLAARDIIQTPFVALNADDFYGAGSFRLLAEHLRSPQTGPLPEYSMVGFRLRPTLSKHGSVARGVCRCDDQGYLTAIAELTHIEQHGEGALHTGPDGQVERLTGDEVVSMNIWGFLADVFPLLETSFSEFLSRHATEPKAEFYIPVMINHAIARQRARIKVLPGNDPWFGVTYREDKPMVVARLRQLINDGVYPERLWD